MTRCHEAPDRYRRQEGWARGDIVQKQTFMLLATAWGAKHGGINAFNVDFARGLAKFLGERRKGVLRSLDGNPG